MPSLRPRPGRGRSCVTRQDLEVEEDALLDPHKAPPGRVSERHSPAPGAQPELVAGQTVPNLVMAKVGADGEVAVYDNAGFAPVVLDVVGWYWT